MPEDNIRTQTQGNVMPKLVVLITKRPEITRAQFREYYEKNHAPLAKRLLPMIGRYTRSYLPDEPQRPGRGDAPDFDVVTELWFKDDTTFEAFQERMADPVVSAAIRADEANFLLSDRVRSYLVTECGDCPTC